MALSNVLRLDPNQQQRIEALAGEQLRSPEFVLHDAIEEYLAKQSSQNEVVLSAQELEELDFRWERYQRTGLHVTHEEVSDWVRRLESDPHAPAPRCHI